MWLSIYLFLKGGLSLSRGARTHMHTIFIFIITFSTYFLFFWRHFATGTFAKVFKATWRGETVAVKQLKEEYCEEASVLAAIRKEADLLFKLSHRSIVKMYGASDLVDLTEGLLFMILILNVFRFPFVTDIFFPRSHLPAFN